jgi:potassium-transporting ATPase potassium-binding subunit
MSVANLLQYGAFLLIVAVLVKPVGGYLARVFGGEPTWLDPLLRPPERIIYRLAGVDAAREMDWKEYATAFLSFSLVGTLILYGLLRVQPLFHTFDPAYQPGPLKPDLAMNTAVSFATTTTWQAYAGETTLTYFSQVFGLAAQNFLAGAAGLAVGLAFMRGLARERTDTLGNFWVDVTRAALWILLPLAVIGTLVLVWQGVPLNFDPYRSIELVQATRDSQGKAVTTQLIPMGPVAALELIKNLGTNGGGFFNVNGAHPYENPTPLTNMLELLAIAVLPAALTHTFGRMVRCPRHGWVLFAVMAMLFVTGLLVADWAERGGHPRISTPGLDAVTCGGQVGGNMEARRRASESEDRCWRR